MKTRAELVNRALQEVGAKAAGQPAAAADVQTMDDAVDSVMDSLSTRGIYQWGDPDQIDDDAFEHLAICIAHSRRRVFGTEAPTLEDKLLAERDLRALQQTTLSGQRQQVEWF